MSETRDTPVQRQGEGTPPVERLDEQPPKPEVGVVKWDGTETAVTPSKPRAKPKKDSFDQIAGETDGTTTSATTRIAHLPANSLPTGTRIIPDEANSGSGELEAVNDTPHDACVIVIDVDTHARVRKVFIKAQDSYSLDHLAQGNYKVLFATGVDWDNVGERFNRSASYFEFGKLLSFQERSDSQYLHYERHSITLNAVPEGNVRPKPISEAEFHALSGKR